MAYSSFWKNKKKILGRVRALNLTVPLGSGQLQFKARVDL